MKNKLVQTSGFTILEALVASTLTIIGISTFMLIRTNIVKTTDQISGGLEISIDGSFAERGIFADLTKADSSFGTIALKDDIGATFFDFAPDVPVGFFPPEKRTRHLVLSSDLRTEFIFAIRDDLTGPPFFYDVVNAYNVGSTTTFSESAALTFVSLNRKGWVKNLQEEYGKNFPTARKPSWWKNGQILMLDTPARFRPLTDDGIDFSQLPRSPIFVGEVHGNVLEPLPSELQTYFNLTNPENGREIGSVDAFFRTLPSVGGGQPLVRVRPLKLLKYTLSPSKASKGEEVKKLWSKELSKCLQPQDLLRAVYRNKEWGHLSKQADKIGGIVFDRSSITSKVVGFKIHKLIKPVGDVDCR